MSVEFAIVEARMNEKNLAPKVTKSKKYKTWVSVEDERRCFTCATGHGTIWLIRELPLVKPPIHLFCRCRVKALGAITAGTATFNGIDGADWWLKYIRELPDYYITQQGLKELGWQRGDNVSDYCDKHLTKGVYRNANGHLPKSPGRVWYEADINYIEGQRNSQRILWSNDGLIFVTFDHYETFYEII